jgi:predicted dinucleotide-binding enzyme
MNITVLGTGRMGSALATAFASRTTHTILVRGSHSKSRSAKALAQGLNIAVAGEGELLRADAIVVAIPWDALDSVARDLKGYDGLVVSAVVPWSDRGDPISSAGSAAERIASLLPGATVATAFTSVSSILVRDPPLLERPSVLVCCNDEPDKKRVMDLVKDVGFDPVDIGTLASARYAEELGLIVLHLAYTAGFGDRVSCKVSVF